MFGGSREILNYCKSRSHRSSISYGISASHLISADLSYRNAPPPIAPAVGGTNLYVSGLPPATWRRETGSIMDISWI